MEISDGDISRSRKASGSRPIYAASTQNDCSREDGSADRDGLDGCGQALFVDEGERGHKTGTAERNGTAAEADAAEGRSGAGERDTGCLGKEGGREEYSNRKEPAVVGDRQGECEDNWFGGEGNKFGGERKMVGGDGKKSYLKWGKRDGKRKNCLMEHSAERNADRNWRRNEGEEGEEEGEEEEEGNGWLLGGREGKDGKSEKIESDQRKDELWKDNGKRDIGRKKKDREGKMNGKEMIAFEEEDEEESEEEEERCEEGRKDEGKTKENEGNEKEMKKNDLPFCSIRKGRGNGKKK
ncbi:uncharacterized protein MONOS_18371 [Monocercomonoides exilis]|uniref:uncharacterized protein n=1 Tax=Monocercomonoides exilis TaxID=2049356 RepID=UPI00355A674A|nr:hypothetical protein MONOS_18371 [Monocercomonoides exilis]